MKIEIWSDVVCPWCYIGKRHLESALATLSAEDPELAAEIVVEWRSFELDPTAPTDEPIDLATMLAEKYGTTRDGALSMMANVSEVAAQAGLDYRFDLTTRSNSFDAHRLIHFAAEHGRQGEMKERLLAAYFCEGARLSDRTTLATLAAEVGLAPDEVSTMLAGETFSTEVRSDERRARELGISGVPFFLVDGVAGVSGAQPPERLVQMIRQAATKRAATNRGSA